MLKHFQLSTVDEVTKISLAVGTFFGEVSEKLFRVVIHWCMRGKKHCPLKGDSMMSVYAGLCDLVMSTLPWTDDSRMRTLFYTWWL